MGKETDDEASKKPAQVINFPPHKLVSRPQLMQKMMDQQNIDRATVTSEIVSNWPSHQVWPFKLGIPTLAVAAGGTGYFLNRTVRNALYLGQHGRFASYAGLMTLPALLAGICHGVFVSKKMFEAKDISSSCPVCLQVRAAVLQVGWGLFYPILTAPIFNYTFAARMKDIYLPKIHKRPWEVWEYTKSMYRPMKGQFGVIGAAQVILAMGITYLEQDCYFNTILPVLEGKETFVKPPYQFNTTSSTK